jgi:serine phosphatase RsbU (regulator of sigma subunit)
MTIINSADKSTAILFLNNILLFLLYVEGEVSLGEGNCVLFCSNGLVEAHDPKGEMFGFPRLRALVAEHAEERPLGEFLLERVYYFVGEGWEQEDDITLLTLKRSASLS